MDRVAVRGHEAFREHDAQKLPLPCCGAQDQHSVDFPWNPNPQELAYCYAENFDLGTHNHLLVVVL